MTSACCVTCSVHIFTSKIVSYPALQVTTCSGNVTYTNAHPIPSLPLWLYFSGPLLSRSVGQRAAVAVHQHRTSVLPGRIGRRDKDYSGQSKCQFIRLGYVSRILSTLVQIEVQFPTHRTDWTRLSRRIHSSYHRFHNPQSQSAFACEICRAVLFHINTSPTNHNHGGLLDYQRGLGNVIAKHFGSLCDVLKRIKRYEDSKTICYQRRYPPATE